MRLTEIMSSLHLSIYTQIALVIFIAVFIAVLLKVFLTKSDVHAHHSSIPLDDDATTLQPNQPSAEATK